MENVYRWRGDLPCGGVTRFDAPATGHPPAPLDPAACAAPVAVAKQGKVKSAARLRSKLLEVLVSGNPAASGSVIVTLQASGGPAYELAARGAPPARGYLVYTLLENVSNAPVTGIAPRGLLGRGAVHGEVPHRAHPASQRLGPQAWPSKPSRSAADSLPDSAGHSTPLTGFWPAFRNTSPIQLTLSQPSSSSQM